MKGLDNAKNEMVITRNKSENKLTLTQGYYTHESVHCTIIKVEEEMKEMSNIPYANAIGFIMFFSGLAHAISFSSRFLVNPSKPRWVGLKWLLRYIVSTLILGLVYEKCLIN